MRLIDRISIMEEKINTIESIINFENEDEPTQLDKIEANLDFIVMINS